MNRTKSTNTPANNIRYTVNESPKDFYSFLRASLRLSLLAIFIFLIYSNTLGSPFVFDDGHNILRNPHIRLTKLTLKGIRSAGIESPSPQRPVSNISFALNYYFHQYNTLGYHLVNILIHITTGFFLYFIIKTTLTILISSSCDQFSNSLISQSLNPSVASFFAALIWLVHPIQIQSVTYIVQRMNSLAAMFFIISLLLYAKGRIVQQQPVPGTKHPLSHYFWFAGCVLAGMLAIGSKEIAATLPFFIFLYEWYFFQNLSRTWLKRNIFLLASIVIILSFFVFFYLGLHPLKSILSGYTHRDFTLTQRVLTEFRVVIFYLSLLILPHPSRLNLDHHFLISSSLIDPATTLLSIVAVTGLIGTAFYTAKKNRLLSFSILWFLGNLVIESSVIGLEIIFEHRNYLPSMFISLMVVVLIFRYINSKSTGVVVLFLIVILCSLWTYERNSVWCNEVTLWQDSVEKSPHKSRPQNNLGLALAKQDRTAEAISHYTEALRINPDFAEAHNNMGLALEKLGKTAEAVRHYAEALRINPGFKEVHSNLGLILIKKERADDAIRHYNRVLKMNPDFAEAHNNLGLALAKQGNLNEAVKHFTKAVKINPDNTNAHNNLGLAYEKQGKTAAALRHYKEALRLNPYFEELHTNYGNLLIKLGRVDEAISHYLEALRINPGFVNAHINLGATMEKLGRPSEAIRHYTEALKLNPDLAEAHNNMGFILYEHGRVDEAIKHYYEALRIDPNLFTTHNNLGVALAGQGKIDMAIIHFQEVLRIDPGHAEVHNNLGAALFKQRKTEEAIASFKEALQIDPGYKDAQYNLKKALTVKNRAN